MRAMASVRAWVFTTAAVALVGCADAPERIVSAHVDARSPSRAVSTGGLQFTMMAMASQTVCGLEKKGTIYCWGLNNVGQLGDGTTDFASTRPRALASTERFTHVAHSYAHGCGVTKSRRAFCWGYNGNGRLGVTGLEMTNTPVEVSGGLLWKTVAVGPYHTCGIRHDGALVDLDGRGYCWGMSAYIGDHNFFGPDRYTPTLTENRGPVPVGGGSFPYLRMYRMIAGGYATCALSESVDPITDLPNGAPTLWKCWGSNEFGQFGYGGLLSFPVYPYPSFTTVTWPNTSALDQLSIEFQNIGSAFCMIARTVSVASPRQAWCAGLNTKGQIGDGTQVTRVDMTPVIGGTEFESISGGALHTCALNKRGQAYCWGENNVGQLGNGTTTPSLVPVPVTSPVAFEKIYAGNFSTCALTKDGVAYCWGANGTGELGDGTAINRLVPTPVASP